MKRKAVLRIALLLVAFMVGSSSVLAAKAFTLNASVDFQPQEIVVTSSIDFIYASIQLPEGYSPADIDVSTVVLENLFLAEWYNIQADILVVGFDGLSVTSYLLERLYHMGVSEANIELRVTGTLYIGVLFDGGNIVHVSLGPREKLLGKYNVTAYYCVYNSEIAGAQTYTKTIPDKRTRQKDKIALTLKASFWFGGKGVAMQGTGRVEAGGLYVRYEDGGVGWIKIGSPQWKAVERRYQELGITDFTGFGGLALLNPDGASFSVTGSVIGAAGRELVPWYSIAAPSRIPFDTSGYIEFLTGTTPDGKELMPFRIDDRGGAIIESRIDVYVGEGESALSQWYLTGGNREGLVYIYG